MIPSSSTLSLLANRCPRAVDYAEDGAPRDGEVFEAGTAAHALMDRVHRYALASDDPLTPADVERIAHETTASLTTRGRRYKGRTEAPLDLERTRAGVAMAESYIASTGYALPSYAAPEVALAVNSRWEPVEWGDPSAHYAGIIDCPYVEEDDWDRVVLVVRDYKTAWTADETLTDSLQMRGYLLLVLAHVERLFPDLEGDPALIRLEIVSLRTRQTWAQVIEVPTLDDETLMTWRREIDTLIAAIGHRPSEGRPAKPGPRCLGCMYRLHCDAAPDETPDTMAARHAYHLAQADALKPSLQEATAAHPIDVDGRRLGWVATTRAKVTDDAPEALAALYLPNAPLPGGLKTLLSHVITASGVRKAVKIIKGKGSKARRAEVEAECLTMTRGRRWEWSKIPESENTNDTNNAGASDE